MRLSSIDTFFIATILCCVSRGLSFEYEDESRDKYISRRAIDGTRGRKYFNPKEDGFFDDYGFDKGQYHAAKEKLGYSDLRSNVPGEPGVDYPAFVRIPRTSFSCIERERGYYADEEAGCQVFHVCDEGLVSSFLCPVGSLFSQRLLTCDWWSKVPCSQSREFYGLQSHSQDVSLTGDALALTETPDYRHLPTPKKDNDETSSIIINVNQLRPSKRKPQIRGQRVQTTVEFSSDSPVFRIKTLEDEKRPRAANSRSTNVDLPPTQTPVTTLASTTLKSLTTISTTTTTTSPYEVPSEQDENALIETPAKNGLDEIEAKETENSALEYEDMEGRESIGLVSSHAERNLEREETKSTEAAQDQKDTATTLEFFETTTPEPTTPITEFVTQQDENIQAKESIGLIRSKIKEKLQLYDNGEKTQQPENQENVITTENSTEAFTEATTSYLFPETETPQPLKTQEVRKMSGFRINVAEKKNADSTTVPTDESDTSDLPTTSNDSFTTLTTPETTENLQAQTTTNNVRRISDTVEESNSPFEVTLTLNGSSNLLKSNEQSPIGVDILSRLISQHENQPIDLADLEIVRSDQTNRNVASNQHRNQNTNSASDVSIHQHLRNYPSQHQPQSVSISTFNNYQNSEQFVPTTEASQSTPENFENRGVELPNFENYQTYVASTTPVPEESFRNYGDESKKYKTFSTVEPVSPFTQRNRETFRYSHDYRDESLDYRNYPTEQPLNLNNQNYVLSTKQMPQRYENQNNRVTLKNYQTNREEARNFRNPKAQKFASTTIRNFLEYEEDVPSAANYQPHLSEFNGLKNYQSQHQEPRNLKSNQFNENYPQTSNFDNYRDNQQDYKSFVRQNFRNQQTSQSEPQHQPFVNFKNEPNVKYTDYQNYDSSEELVQNMNFGDFGVRLVAKNPNVNMYKLSNQRLKITDDSNAFSINSGLQGKTANLLHAMSQLAKNDRIPRPFQGKPTQHYQNNFANVYNNARNNVADINDFSSEYNKINSNKTQVFDNFNVNVDGNFNFTDDQYSIVVDDFAAPKLVKNNFNLFTNQRDERILPNFVVNQNVSELRKEKILNYNVASSISESPVDLSNVNVFGIHNNPESNTVPFINQQFVPISQSDFNDYEHDSNLKNPSLDYSVETNKNTNFVNIPESIDFTERPADNTPTQTVEPRPSTPKMSENEQRQPTYNVTKTTTKTTVETEFIPSLSFDFGSDQGRKEYLEALEKGIVPNDRASKRVDDDDDDTSATEKSEIMDNFKDTKEVMSGIE